MINSPCIHDSNSSRPKTISSGSFQDGWDVSAHYRLHRVHESPAEKRPTATPPGLMGRAFRPRRQRRREESPFAPPDLAVGQCSLRKLWWEIGSTRRGVWMCDVNARELGLQRLTCTAQFLTLFF
jgi:hypothetical protein